METENSNIEKSINVFNYPIRAFFVLKTFLYSYNNHEHKNYHMHFSYL